MGYVGRPIRRKEDPKLITGRGRYVDDLELPGTLFMAIVRSPVAHGVLKKVDYSDALKVPGVVGVIAGLKVKVDNRPENFPMAVNELLYVGQPVAAVVAKDRYSAMDGAEAVQLDYEELQAVIDPEKALQSKGVVEGKAVAYEREYVSGDPEGAINSSPKKLEMKLRIGRVYASPMETRGVLSVYDGNSLTVYASTQSPHFMRRFLLDAFGGRVNNLRVEQADTGGAFGAKLFPYPEDYITVEASLRFKRPVKWIGTRREDFVSTYLSRDQVHKVRFGFDQRGTLMGLTDELIINLGAASHGYYLGDITATMLPGPYGVKNVRVNVVGVHTNTTPLDQYRGAGRPEATFVIERIMDYIADEIGADPVEVRKRNLVRELPYINPFGLTYDSGNYQHLLERAGEAYAELERKAQALRTQGRRVGVGLCFYLEQNNFGPWESASVRVRGDGKVSVIMGAAPHGQGTGTGVAQVVADELGIDIDDVEVSWGDTSQIGEAFGTYGSRSLTLAGNAALLAARRLKDKVRALASEIMGTDVEELVYKQGGVENPKDGRRMELRDVAKFTVASMGGTWNFKSDPSLEVTEYFGLNNYTFPYGAHVALVEVEDDGSVKVLDYRAIDDVGVVVNPMLAQGQVMGGIIQGYGEVFTEEIKYDDQGNPLSTDFSSYGLPRAHHSFRVSWEFMEEGKSAAPLPAKGIGEGASIGSLNALVRAVERATKSRITEVPVRAEGLVRV